MVPPPVGTPPVVPPVGTCQVSVTITDPTNGNLTVATGTTGVANGGKRITATLSGTVDATTINSTTFRLAQTGQPPLVPASVGYDATSQVATLTTSAPLLPATDYTVVFTPNAPVPPCAFTWSFRTAPVAAVAPSPVNFGAASSFAIAATAGAANTAATLINGDVVLNPTDTCNAVAVGSSGTFGLCGGAPPTSTARSSPRPIRTRPWRSR